LVPLLYLELNKIPTDSALRGEVRLQGSSTVLPTTLEIVTELSENKQK
jgi:ABC-type phosphate transport system substrate-binding protein